MSVGEHYFVDINVKSSYHTSSTDLKNRCLHVIYGHRNMCISSINSNALQQQRVEHCHPTGWETAGSIRIYSPISWL